MALWFKYYSDVLHNPRVQSLPGDLFKVWVNAMSIASLEDTGKDGRLPTVEKCAYLMRMEAPALDEAFQYLVAAGLLETSGDKSGKKGRKNPADETKAETIGNGEVKRFDPVSWGKNETLFETYFLRNWGKKQYKSDHSTQRVRDWRNAKRNATDQIRSDKEKDKIRSGAGSGSLNFDIDFFLNDDDRDKFRRDFPGMALQEHIRIFNEYIADKEKPRDPVAAFFGWARKFIKKRRA